MITNFRKNMKFSFCVSCSDYLNCAANAHTLRYVLTVLKHMRYMRLNHGVGASQCLYRIIGQPLTMVFMEKLCDVIDAPSDVTPSESSDRFFRSKIVPNGHTGLKDLFLFSDLHFYFSAYDLFGMSYSAFYDHSTNSDIRLRALPTSDK